ncbi:hypothetical protein [Streptomyces sp. NBC_00893]|uniref:hypothetical protein n=1 Tax=Streptomyces sp. NBC_00893 TaxID=2975862 RepID=UPI002253E811|nr:hypothetical protein [Streptomyces sp. NBC_00893]MCX4850606.1 hypothetical protein [Streptomyces sp. NBC_00893]
MKLSHDNMVGRHLAVSLVNLGSSGSWGLRHRWSMRSGIACDWLGRRESQGVVAAFESHFAAISQAEPCEMINALLADGTGSVHDGLPPHLPFASDGRDPKAA